MCKEVDSGWTPISEEEGSSMAGELVQLYNADSANKIKELGDNTVDAIVTDPPYDINFMGKGWDKDSLITNVDFWKECLRVLKPGGHLLAFGHSRTSHRMVTAVENAGFQIRDTVMWIYGSGFPKSHNVAIALDKKNDAMGHRGKRFDIAGNNNQGGEDLERLHPPKHEPITDVAKEWEGWGTALKPAHEPITLARKPLEGSVADNCNKWGVGALNIDATRIAHNENFSNLKPVHKGFAGIDGTEENNHEDEKQKEALQISIDKLKNLGRFPANVMFDEEAGEVLDKQAPNKGSLFQKKRNKATSGGSGDSWTNGGKDAGEDNGYYDAPSGASKFFYCPKVNKKERNKGATNNHPTVKPIALMEYLCKLVSREGHTVLDPFMGSGSTGIAAKRLHRNFIGIERDSDYYNIAAARIEAATKDKNK
jgi:site-specific DNA-methyltransferase (adenine-specific)